MNEGSYVKITAAAIKVRFTSLTFTRRASNTIFKGNTGKRIIERPSKTD